MKKHTFSIYDISQALQLSPATVSRVLNHPEQVNKKTRDRVLQYMEQVNYQKRSYTSSREDERNSPAASYSAAYLLSIPSASNPFYADIIEGTMTAAAQHSCRIYVDYTALNENNIQSFLGRVTGNFRGILSLQQLSESILSRISAKIPIVQCSEAAPKYSEISSISIDNVQAEKKAAEYLLSLGCRKFSFFTTMSPYRFSEDRLQGLLLALEEAMLTLPNDRIVRVSSMEYHTAFDAALDHLKKSCPDAVVCISDVFAAACINAAHTLSIRVPEDMMVIGFDNIAVSITTSPTITTIDQPRFQLGFHAFETLYREVQEPYAEKTRLLLPTELLIRQSTGTGAGDRFPERPVFSSVSDDRHE